MIATKHDADSLKNAATAVETAKTVIGLAFRAYDEMTPTERSMFVTSLERFDLSSALDRIMDKVSISLAKDEAGIDRKAIVDEDTGLSYIVVESGASQDVQDYCRDITVENSNE